MWNILWNRLHTMQTIQVVLDNKLLTAADRVARKLKQNRSELIREALRRHLRALEIRELEQRDRAGYVKQPQTGEDYIAFEAVTWPDE